MSIASPYTSGTFTVNEFSIGATLSYVPTIPSTSTGTGALIVNGGVGISGNTYVGGNLNVIGNAIIGNIGAPYVPSTSTTTGALIVNGGVGILGNLYIGGNVRLGPPALQNVTFGFNPLNSITTGTNNSAFGYQPLYTNTSGINNNAFGYNSLYLNQTGSANNALGYFALYNNVASNNTAVGHQASTANTSGLNNVAVGYQSQYSNTIGNYNTVVGASAMFKATTGIRNTVIGNAALYNVTIGGNNVAVGDSVGGNIVLGMFNTFVGTGATSTVDVSYSTAIGYNAIATSNNQIVFGTPAESVSIPGNVYIGNTLPSTSFVTGSLVVNGGIGITGNTFIGNAVSALQYIENINSIVWSATPTINFTRGLITYFNTSATTAITSLTITSVPITALCSYTFTFIIPATNSANYINPTGGTITINSTGGITLRGTITLSTPAAYIMQQISIMNISATTTPSFIALTTAQAY